MGTENKEMEPQVPCSSCRLTGSLAISGLGSYAWYLRHTTPKHKNFYGSITVIAAVGLAAYTKIQLDREKSYNEWKNEITNESG